uniref:[histone H3]-lysine(4) N-methyltransferase n=1 Tax=Cyprinus carpio TaxID=7962 RepID=A0A8C2KDP1_CYPCA
MSSEEKSLDPSDKGPSPPPNSSGATPTGSPAPTDKRPRGRPRKDVLSTATPLQSVPRQRKKNRGRGKALVEDEESTDGMETAETGSTQETGNCSLRTVIHAILIHRLTAFLWSPHSEQLCAFCYCAGRSLLGQGDLKPFRVTPGYDPPLPQSSTEEGHDRDDKSGAASQSGSVGAEEGGGRFWEELRRVGLPDDIDVRTLFDESGQCWAHQSCALWSNFVCQAEDQSLLNVDKAIHSGSTEHCAYCKRLGASIKCCEEGCDRSYHFPCAGAAGTFQDFRRRSVLCTEHIELAVKEANCILCDSPGDLLDQLFCTSCGLHYHGMCLDISVTPLKRAGWQCPECKVCQTCKEPGEDTKMLVCDMCDKGYHTFCLQPAMDSIPINGWRCKNCRMCVQCGIRSSEQWHHNSLLCQNCGDQQDTTVPCLCPSDVDPNVHKDLLSCHQCKRWFHPECERPGEGHTHPQSKDDHICSICRNAGSESDPVRTDAEGIKAEIQSHVDVEENAQPVPTNNDSEPAEVQDVEPHQPVSERQSEERQIEEKQMTGKTNFMILNVLLLLAFAVTSPQETKGPEDSEPHEQELVSAPETSTVQQLVFETEEPPETSSTLTENISQNEDDSKPFLEEQKTNLSPTKESTPACTSHEEEPMEVSFTEEPSTMALPSVGHRASHLHLQAVSGQAISNVPSSTFIPFTPKIGMGKPAISKRKFSPGRPRVKQGAWSASRRPSSPSWSLDPTEGWDGPKSRQPHSTAAWIIRVGRGSGFPSRRRPRGSGVTGRGGRGRARMKNGINIMEPICTFKEEEENALHNTVVIFSSTDTFTMKQDMCVVCGSFGQGVEGRLLACAQCGQCYHPFCVNIKITKVVLSKGWRCLECTVCEACGQASDPGRLLLCDNCDISYHTYCLDPPLQNVPNGSWKCKWCVSCTQCGATSAGPRCEWQNNYTQCAPCASLASCPLCQQDYNEEEIILQCRQCDRWIHASCQGILSEEEVEKIADTSFDCSLCQAPGTPAKSCLDLVESVFMPQRVTKTRDPDLTRTYTQDGVCLTESGLSQLQSLANAASRRRRSKPKLKLKIINQNSVAVLQTPPDPQTELSRDADLDDTKKEVEMVDGEGKSDSSPEREAAAEDDSKDTDPCKKRKRKPYRPGIGGFMVRQRNRMGPGRTKQALFRKDSTGSETLQGKDESWGDQAPDTPVDEKPPLSDFPDNPEVKIRKRYRKKKTKLEEAFPTYLQDASLSSQTHLGRTHIRQVPEEPLDGILSPELDKMVTEGLYNKCIIDPFLAELGGKDVEDLFTAVLSPSTSQPPQMPQQIQGAQTLQGPTGPGLHPSQPNSGLLQENKKYQGSRLDRKFNLIAQETAGPWSATGSTSASAPAAASEVEGDSLSTAQKSTLKWEKEETLGELATVAPVLYTNVNFPNLKEEYPDWSTRVKQIAKLWRKASSQDRAPYVQKARDNRAALRINKVQMSNETIKRQPPQPQQPLEVFDPAIPPLDPELLFKDPLKHKESEHEQEWKYRQQMRQKSKQQAKIEATQKLEQVKNEQLQQQQQQQLPSISQYEHDSSSNLKSPVSVHSNDGNMSPKQPSSKNGVSNLQMPGTPTSCSPDDVFLRPHPPPPSSGSQPQSPQMFSPSSSGSRPSSPWDPYTKMVGTPRPPTIGQGTPRRNSESGKSPRGLSEPIGSPTAICNDPYAKPPDTPRPAGATDPFLKPMCPPRASQTLEGRHLIGSPGHDPFSRVSVRKEAYQRMPQGRMILSDPYARPLLTPIPGSNESGSVQVFKTPMPPPQAQEQYGGMHARRASGDPFERPMMPPRSSEGFSQNQQNDPYAQPPLTPRPAVSDGYANQRVSRQPQTLPFSQPGPMARQPSCNPYARAPSTSRLDYSQCDPYGQQPATPRPSSDPFTQSPFSNPYTRMPGTPRPHDPEPYSQQPVSRHPVMMNQPSQQQTQNHIMSMDPYAQPPGTPRSGMADRFPNQPPGLPRFVGPDPQAQSVRRSQSLPNDSCAHPPRTPHPGGIGQGLGPGPMSNQDPFSPPQVLMLDTFANPTKLGPQPLKPLAMTDETGSQLLSSRPNQTPIHDLFEQLQYIICTIPFNITLICSQRQRIRELILKQQQQKSAIRQDKGVQDHPLTMPPGTPQHWSQESTGQQSEIFNRPPPPYPGPGAVRAPQRFHGPFPGDQQGHFPEGQFPRLQFPGDADSNIRQLGMPITPNIQGPLGAPRPHQMQDPIIEAHPQMRRSMSMDLGKSIGGNPLVTSHLPPRGMHVQQHNIMGQPFIELRHRAPDSRLRLPFGSLTMQGNRMELPSQQRPPGFMDGQEMGFPFNQIPKPMDTTMNQSQVANTQMQASLSLGNLQQANTPLRAGHPQVPLTRSISQPASNEALSAPLLTNIAATSAVQNDEVPLSTNEVPEEKIDTDESAVKDLEDVEVKDFVDADLENLNLDPDDGKDLDLETNDLHLDDFLTSGKFDIIAYAVADLDLSEDLDLSDPIEDHTETSDFQKTKAEKKTDSFDGSSCSTLTAKEVVDKTAQSQGHIGLDVPQDQVLVSLKTEEDSKNGIKDCLSQDTSCKNQVNDGAAINQAGFENDIDASLQDSKSGIHSDATPVLSSMLVNVPLEGESQKQEHCGQSGAQSNPPNQEATMSLSSTMPGQGNFSVQGRDTNFSIDQSLVSSHGESALEVPGSIQEHQQSHIFGLDQKDAVLSGEQHSILTQQAMLSQQDLQNRPLLLEEQPLLLQDLLDQERQEQQQQKQMQAMIRHHSSESFFPNIDFDAITDPIMKAKMVALKGINKMMVQNNMGMSPMSVMIDDKLAPHMARPNPPNFGTGFPHDAQKVQYEDWLRETQQLLQMQQKFLEEQIGAHRKSKKALSAKQRTAKKAGREFPEEDAEQLKHVTEQQGVVQKQLEQIRKQQKEHAELIEEYRVKQQQQGGMQPAMMHGMPPMQPHAGMMPVGPPMNQPMMGPMMPIRLHPGQPDAANVTNTAGWHPGAPVPSGGPQMPGVMPAQVVQAQPPQPAVARPSQGQAGGESSHVNFDDTNPFSEGFQERERKERLREQQERQRVQLMKEVERQRVKHCMEQQQVPNCQDGTMRALSQMPFYNQELPQDFMQPPRMQQQMQCPPFPQQQGMQPGFVGGPSRPMMGNGPFPQEMGPGFVPENLAPHGPNFVQAQTRPQRYPGPNMMPQNPTQGHQFPNFPGPGPSLIQLYSNIIPEEKGKKKRNRKKKKDDDCESLRAPSTPHSDLTAPLTPCVSDTSSTPTRNPMVFGDHEFCETSQPGSSTPGSMSSQPHSELERQLSEGSCGGGPEMAMAQQEMHDRILSNIKLEKVEASDCHGHKEMEMEMGLGMVKVEGGREGMLPHPASQSPANSSKGEAGNELLKHLLKNKRTPPPALPHQRSEDSLRPEEEGSTDYKAFLRQNLNHPDFPGPLLPEDKKKQRNKRAPKSGDRPAPRCKKRKKEEDGNRAVYSSTEPVMTQLKQQNNLSNPPTPPASLPPTPPPVARQKLLNGFATTEELASKGAVIVGHDVTKGLLSRPLQFKAEEELLAQALAQGPKTVNVPASLPTPPHNNQEELRGQEHCEDRDTPDSFVPSSSPESVVGMEISRYPDLSLVKEEPPSPALSPVIPMFPVFRGKGSEVRLREVKTEPSSVFFGSPFGSVQNGSNTGLVSIAITLKPAAAENITDVVAAIADLIRVKIPSSYEVSSGPGGTMGAIKTSVDPQRLTSAHHEPNGLRATQLLHNHNKKPFLFIDNCGCLSGLVGGRAQNKKIQESPGPKQQWCQHCKVVVLGNGVRKITKDEQGKAQESPLCSDAGLVFCSHSCLILHSSSSQSNGNASVALLPESALKQSPSKVQHQYSNNMSSLDVHCLAQLQPKPSPSSMNLHTAFAPAEAARAIKIESKPESISESHLKMTVKLKPCSQSHMEDKPWHHGKRWKGLRWRKWTVHITIPKVATQTSESEVEELLQQLNSSLRPCSTTLDRRRCCFCQQIGDGMTDGPARLLNLDLDTWVHLNCALWSSEVYETQAGALINVELARQRGQMVVCAFCQRLGATSGCHRLRCLNIYHFTCALQAGCTFFKDKTMLCHQHRPRGSGAAAGLHLEQQLRCFSVFRRVFVQRDELRQLAAAVQQPERGHTFRVGSLLFHAMGQLPPALLPTFHSSTAIFPPGYEVSRLYWSMRHGQKRCRYVCSVEEHEGRPEFSIRVIEQGYEDLVLTDTTAKGVWDKVLGPVAERRAETGMLRLFPVYLKGEDLFGLTVSAVTRIAESLPGVEACSRYRFRYGRNPMLVLPLSINPSGCARSELSVGGCFFKMLHTINFNSTVVERGSSHSKHFVHSKSSQYRRLTSDWKTNVYLAHSRIQGLGLFAARDIEKQTMVIEYMGDVLRAEVAMRKELLYKAKNRPAYMFRISSERVIDATRSGSPARYINHSCSPNCVAEVVTFERGHKIIISAARRIERGEELCYDYKLTPVADQSKIPCHCGAANCRKWIN